MCAQCLRWRGCRSSFEAITRPLLTPHFKVGDSSCLLLLFLNLPGWRWGSITQNPLVAVSRPLHSGVCETRQDIGLPVLHSEISDSGLLRTRGDQQKITTRKTRRCPVLCFSKSVFVVVSYVFVFMPLCLPVFMLERLSFKNKRRSSSSWGMNQSTHPSLHRSHFGSRYQSGRCALRSPFMQP